MRQQRAAGEAGGRLQGLMRESGEEEKKKTRTWADTVTVTAKQNEGSHNGDTSEREFVICALMKR